MKITGRTVEIAVLDVFSRYGVYAGGRLMLNDVEASWAQTGLRRGDLVDGLSQLINMSAVKLVSEADGLFLELTTRGFERMSANKRGLREIWEESRSVAVLKRAQMRRREQVPASGRRMLDMPIPQ
ncbi:hypothetical protein RM530_06865 [Algiphilus sp. W345]|uniref:Uncharacterized protein n=1 Tax=Banduia mediterranea TaxID=3075609 RepID=A0ABU2WIG6_9GAMM|nr:hypothetical protein [Algiphilus sp. W345]MDT0497086.1 hypothetical protein [Algiphilus sp. W345]